MQIMKKLYSILACLWAASFCLTACSDEGTKESASTNLTPDEHKEKLEDIGLAVLSKVKPEDHKTLLTTIDKFIEYVDNSDLDLERNEDVQAAVNLARTMGDICSCTDAAKLMAFARSGNNDLYTAAQYAKVYTYNNNNGTWTSAPASDNTLEFRFPVNNQQAVLKATASGNETLVDLFDDEDGIHYQALIPEKATASFTLDGQALGDAAVTVAVNNESRTADVACTFNANGYEFNANVHADKSNATANFSTVIKGETLLTATANISGNNMTDEGQINGTVNGTYDAEEMFNGADVEILVNNEARIIASCSNVNNFIKLIDKLEDEYSWEEQTEQEYNDKLADAYNQYNKAELYYTDGDNVIARITMQSYMEENPYYSEETYYDIEPVITFVSDDSSFSIESYFDDISFNDLITSAEDLGEAYEDYLQYLLK